MLFSRKSHSWIWFRLLSKYVLLQIIAFMSLVDSTLPITRAQSKGWIPEWVAGCLFPQCQADGHRQGWQQSTTTSTALEATMGRCVWQQEKGSIPEETCGNLLLQCILEGDWLWQSCFILNLHQMINLPYLFLWSKRSFGPTFFLQLHTSNRYRWMVVRTISDLKGFYFR